MHRDFFECDDQRPLRRTWTGPVATPLLGTFDGRIQLEYQTFPCAFDAGRMFEVWCPGVGMLGWSEAAGNSVWLLVSFENLETPFVRGDADADGFVHLTDAVFLLESLFRGGPLPACGDAADANDSGSLELTDAVYLLGWLFRGTAPLPPRAPQPSDLYDAARSCNTDSTSSDLLGSERFDPCPG